MATFQIDTAEKFLQLTRDELKFLLEDKIDDPEALEFVLQCHQQVNSKHLRVLKIQSIQQSSTEKPKLKLMTPKTGVKIETTQTKAKAPQELYWAEWKEENVTTKDQKFANPTDPGKLLTPYAYFKAHIWPNMTAEEKKPYEERSQRMKEQNKQQKSSAPAEANATTTSTGKIQLKPKISLIPKDSSTSQAGASSGKNECKSGYHLFLDRHKKIMDNKRKYANPNPKTTAREVSLHNLLTNLWSHKLDNDQKREYNEYSENVKSGVVSKFDIRDLPHLDLEKLNQGKYDSLTLIH